MLCRSPYRRSGKIKSRAENGKNPAARKENSRNSAAAARRASDGKMFVADSAMSAERITGQKRREIPATAARDLPPKRQSKE